MNYFDGLLIKINQTSRFNFSFLAAKWARGRLVYLLLYHISRRQIICVVPSICLWKFGSFCSRNMQWCKYSAPNLTNLKSKNICIQIEELKCIFILKVFTEKVANPLKIKIKNVIHQYCITCYITSFYNLLWSTYKMLNLMLSIKKMTLH